MPRRGRRDLSRPIAIQLNPVTLTRKSILTSTLGALLGLALCVALAIGVGSS